MIFTNEQKELSKSCTDCLPWLSICGASCCRQFKLSIVGVGKDLLRPGYILGVPCNLDDDHVNYYKLHGCVYVKGIMGGLGMLKIPMIRWHKISDDEIIVFKDCSALTKNNRCKLYCSSSRPSFCNKTNIDDYKDPKGIYLCSTCLYRCKLEVEKDGVI